MKHVFYPYSDVSCETLYCMDFLIVYIIAIMYFLTCRKLKKVHISSVLGSVFFINI